MTPVKKAETTVCDSVYVNLKKIPVETLNMMSITSNEYLVRIYLIFESQRGFNDYRDSLRNDKRISRSVTHTTSVDVIDKNPQWTVIDATLF